jgi:uncharacterized protein YkwD
MGSGVFYEGMTPMNKLLTLFLFLFASTASAQNWPDLSIPAAPVSEGGNDVVVIVGVEKYAELPAVPGAVFNAEAWYNYFTVTMGLPEEQVTLLTNKKGTREKILKALTEKSKMASKGGALWFVFIGQGAPGFNKNGGLLVGYDTQSEIDSISERCVSLQEALTAVQKGKQSKTFFLVDSGLNGHIPEGELLFGLEHDHSKKSELKSLVTAYKKKSKQELTILTAASGEQYAGPLLGVSVPAFSYLALGGLRGWADSNLDEGVSVQELRDYVASVLLLIATDQIQTPELATMQSDSMMVWSAGEALSIKSSVASNKPSNPKANPPKEDPKPVNPKVNPPKEDPKPDNTTSTSKLGGTKKGPEAIEEMILQKINAARAKAGLSALTQQSKLLKAARDHSQEMAELGYFSHQSPTPGRESFMDRINLSGAKGVSTAGENIVFRQQDISDAEMAEALFQQWMNSPGHRDNILTEDFRVTGLGVFQDGSRCWATQVFADAAK